MRRSASRRLSIVATQTGRFRRRRDRIGDSARSLGATTVRNLDHRPLAVRLLTLMGFVGLGQAIAGPVAAAILGAYATLGVLALQRIRARSQQARSSALSLEALSGLAAELRAGGEAAAVSALVASWSRGDISAGLASNGSGTPAPVVGSDSTEALAVVSRMSVACRVSERLGAPLADLFDSIERDLRALVRLRMSVAAQVTGSWATVVLLAALPPVGLALGAGFGANPLHELLHTRLGGACALLALAMQVLGLLWASALVRKATR